MWKMRLKIQRTLREYLYKIRNSTTMIHSGCKRRLRSAKSFSVGNRNRRQSRNDTATRGGHVRGEEEVDISAKLSDIDQFLAENFKSLYADESESESESESEEAEDPSRLSVSAAAPKQCVAVLTCSPDPEAELRRSMKGMLESRARKRQSMDWAFMEEILMCYLALNDKRSRGFVLGAFVDLVVELRS